MIRNKKIILISWQSYNPHSQLLGNSFHADIHYINDLIITRGLIWKIFFAADYLYKSFKTLTIIISSHPGCVIVQNPVPIAVIISVSLKRILNFKVVADSHNGAFASPWGSFPLHKWALRNADIITVHNYQLLERLKNDKTYTGINFRILNSKLSEFDKQKPPTINADPYFLVVSTFAGDEPMEILLEGIRLFKKNNNDNVLFRLTGNFRKKNSLYEEYKNDAGIEFLGFVSNENYAQLMVNSMGVISLSTRDDVQQFALMEAVGAGVPFISNNNITNKSLFDDKMVLIEIIPEMVAAGIEKFIKKKDELDKNILELRNNIRSKWENDLKLIKSELKIKEISDQLPMNPGSEIIISVCIATYKREILLENLLISLNRQDLPPEIKLEIVITDNNPIASARPIIKKFTNSEKIYYKYLVEPEKNISLARNKCVENTSGRYICFIDDDETASESWIKNLFDH